MGVRREQIVEKGRRFASASGSAKKPLQRFIRRTAKRDPEGAPRKNREAYKGWYA